MTSVLVKRLLQLIPTLIGVTLLTFFLMRMAPGDPARMILGTEATEEALKQMRADLGLDRPIFLQYLTFMGLYPHPAKKDANGVEVPGAYSGVLQLDLGTSYTRKSPVLQEILMRFPATLELALVAMFFATVVGITVGTLSAVNPRSWLDTFTRFFVFIFLAMPAFWLGLELIILLSRGAELFPPGDRGQPWLPEPFASWGFRGNLSHLVLPAATLGLGTGAFLCRILRSSMLQVLSQDYIRTAKAKGLDKASVVIKHGLKNAMIPFVTVAGLSLGGLLGGSVIVETVFNWPGVGRLFVTSIKERDLPVTMGCVLVLATIFVLINLAVDVLYTFLDPRVRLEDEGRS